jgi:hypothetical protein
VIALALARANARVAKAQAKARKAVEAIQSIVCPRCGAYAGDSCHSMASSGWKAIKPHQARVAAAIKASDERSK